MAILSDTNVKLFDWDVALAKFPSACHEDFVERWVGVVAREGIKARPPADMPELFFQELDRRIKSDEEASALSPAQVCININALRLKRVCSVTTSPLLCAGAVNRARRFLKWSTLSRGT
jgi:hypothetical protein